MRWSAIDLDKRLISFTPKKTKRGKRLLRIPLHPDLEKELLKNPGIGNAPLFPSLIGRGTGGATGLSAEFAAIMRKAGVHGEIIRHTANGRGNTTKSFHSLRHSFNSALANAGVARELRQVLTGHASETHERALHSPRAWRDPWRDCGTSDLVKKREFAGIALKLQWHPFIHPEDAAAAIEGKVNDALRGKKNESPAKRIELIKRIIADIHFATLVRNNPELAGRFKKPIPQHFDEDDVFLLKNWRVVRTEKLEIYRDYVTGRLRPYANCSWPQRSTCVA